MHTRFAALLALLLTIPIGLLRAYGHEGHEHYSAGEPGDPKKPARTVQVSMREDGKKMLYEPSLIQVKLGEQIRFVISNDGIYNHEFMLATAAENRKHGALMKKYPDMEHEDPNAVSVASYTVAELVWKFTRKGEFSSPASCPATMRPACTDESS